MARLSDIDATSTASEAVNALNRATRTAANAGRITLANAGGGHGQAWAFWTNGVEVASGSIPLSKHGAHNLGTALRILEAAVTAHGIAD